MAWKAMMKLFFEIVVALLLHPLAVILAWINILGRTDLPPLRKALWVVVTLIWGIGPILYMALEEGALW